MMTEREIAQMTDFTTRVQIASENAQAAIFGAKEAELIGASKSASTALGLLKEATVFLAKGDVRNGGIKLNSGEYELGKAERMIRTDRERQEEDRRTEDDRRRRYNGTSPIVSETVAKQLQGLKLRAA